MKKKFCDVPAERGKSGTYFAAVWNHRRNGRGYHPYARDTHTRAFQLSVVRSGASRRVTLRLFFVAGRAHEATRRARFGWRGRKLRTLLLASHTWRVIWYVVLRLQSVSVDAVVVAIAVCAMALESCWMPKWRHGVSSVRLRSCGLIGRGADSWGCQPAPAGGVVCLALLLATPSGRAEESLYCECRCLPWRCCRGGRSVAALVLRLRVGQGAGD